MRRPNESVTNRPRRGSRGGLREDPRDGGEAARHRPAPPHLARDAHRPHAPGRVRATVAATIAGRPATRRRRAPRRRRRRRRALRPRRSSRSTSTRSTGAAPAGRRPGHAAGPASRPPARMPGAADPPTAATAAATGARAHAGGGTRGHAPTCGARRPGARAAPARRAPPAPDPCEGPRDGERSALRGSSGTLTPRRAGRGRSAVPAGRATPAPASRHTLRWPKRRSALAAAAARRPSVHAVTVGTAGSRWAASRRRASGRCTEPGTRPWHDSQSSRTSTRSTAPVASSAASRSTSTAPERWRPVAAERAPGAVPGHGAEHVPEAGPLELVGDARRAVLDTSPNASTGTSGATSCAATAPASSPAGMFTDPATWPASNASGARPSITAAARRERGGDGLGPSG